MQRIVAFLFLVACFSVGVYSRPSLSDIDLTKVAYPLDPVTLSLVQEAKLVTSFPDFDKESPFVVTPFGVFGRECVHGTESGARITESDNGDLNVELVNGTTYVYPSSKYGCKERFAPQNVKAQRNQTHASSPKAPLDGWLDNGWFFDNVQLGSFTSNYAVPTTPPNPTG